LSCANANRVTEVLVDTNIKRPMPIDMYNVFLGVLIPPL
jgi:hypothetical protein